MDHQNWQKVFYSSDKWFQIIGFKLWRNFQPRTTFSILSKSKSMNIPHSKARLLYALCLDFWANGFHSLVVLYSGKHSYFCYSIYMWFYNAPNMMSLFFPSKDGGKLSICCLKRVIHTVIELFVLIWFSQEILFFSLFNIKKSSYFWC